MASGSSSEPQPSTSRQSPPPPQPLPTVSPILNANWAHEFLTPWEKMSRRNQMSYLERNVRPPPGSICKAGDASSNHRQPSGQPRQQDVGHHCPTDRGQISYWSVLFYVPYWAQYTYNIMQRIMLHLQSASGCIWSSNFRRVAKSLSFRLNGWLAKAKHMPCGRPMTVAKHVLPVSTRNDLERIGSRSQSRLCTKALRTCGP